MAKMHLTTKRGGGAGGTGGDGKKKQQNTLEKEMATPSSVLAWRISWTGEPGGLQSVGSQRVGHN